MAPLEPLEEKTRGPVRRHKRTQRQPLGNGSETAEHHLNPGSGKAKNYHSPGAEVAPLEPLKEKKRAPVRRQKTWGNLTSTNAQGPPFGNGSETAKHHLNPNSGKAKKRSVARGRSGTFGTPIGEEESPGTWAKNVTQPGPHKRPTAAAWQWIRNS